MLVLQGVVQERLGHATTAITLGISSHVMPTLDDLAAQIVADMVYPRRTPARHTRLCAAACRTCVRCPKKVQVADVEGVVSGVDKGAQAEPTRTHRRGTSPSWTHG